MTDAAFIASGFHGAVIPALDEIANDFATGEGRLWAAVVLTAWRDRRWRYFLDPGSTFPLAAACCGLNVGAARERARDRRPKKKA